MPHDGRGPAPLAAKGVLKRWNLPEDQTYVAIPDVVFDCLMRKGITPGEFMVFAAMLSRWNWRRGMRQAISLHAIATTLRRSSRTSIRAALDGMTAKGIIFRQAPKGTGLGRYVVDLAALRDAAMNAAAGRPPEIIKRAPRNGKPIGGGYSNRTGGGTPTDPPGGTPTGPLEGTPTGPHSECSEELQKSDAPRTMSSSGLGARQPGESEEAFRLRAIAILAEDGHALPA